MTITISLMLTSSSLCVQKPTTEERARSNGENLDIESILTIPAVDLSDTGNISCIGTNEAGVNSSTTYLLVVGESHSHKTQDTKRLKHFGKIGCLFCADKPYIRLLPQLAPKLAHKGLSVEVNEGEDLELTVLIEAYPHIVEHRWHTPPSPSTSTQEHKLIRYNNR